MIRIASAALALVFSVNSFAFDHWSHVNLGGTDGSTINIDYKLQDVSIRHDGCYKNCTMAYNAAPLWINFRRADLTEKDSVLAVLINKIKSPWSDWIGRKELTLDLKYRGPGHFSAELGEAYPFSRFPIYNSTYGGTFSYNQEVAIEVTKENGEKQWVVDPVRAGGAEPHNFTFNLYP